MDRAGEIDGNAHGARKKMSIPTDDWAIASRPTLNVAPEVTEKAAPSVGYANSILNFIGVRVPDPQINYSETYIYTRWFNQVVSKAERKIAITHDGGWVGVVNKTCIHR